MTSRAIVLTPPQESHDQQLGFYARSVRVENPTAAYWYLPDQLRFIPPFVTGMIIPLDGTERANILYQTPPGLQQATTLQLSAAASFVYSEAPIGGDAGISLAANAFGRALSVISVGFTNPGTEYVFVQPAPNGFVIVPRSALGGPFNDLRASLSFAGITGGQYVQQIFAQHIFYRNPVGGYPSIIYRRYIPAQSTLLLTGDGLDAELIF